MRHSNVVGILPEVVILLISGFLYSAASTISSVGDGLGADFWPKVILAATVFTCLWEIFRKISTGLRSNRGAMPAGDEHADVSASASNVHEPDVGRWVPWTGIGLTVAYVACMPWLGYFLASSLFVTAFVYVGNYRRPLMAACVGIAASLCFLFLFMRVVYVSLPLGVEPFASVSTSLISVMGVK